MEQYEDVSCITMSHYNKSFLCGDLLHNYNEVMNIEYYYYLPGLHFLYAPAWYAQGQLGFYFFPSYSACKLHLCGIMLCIDCLLHLCPP